MVKYKKGKIVRITPNVYGGTENGFLIDSKNGLQYPFNAPSGLFNVNEEVEFSIVRRKVAGLTREETINLAKIKKI